MFGGICTEVELLGHMVFLLLFRPTVVFFSMASSLYFPIKSAQGLEFFHVLHNICVFFFVVFIVDVSWYLSVVLTCITLMMLDIFSCIGHLHIYLGETPI